jgi:manganese transport protein
MGSGLIVSVAYMDPGNWGTNISGGSQYFYDLLWIIWLASLMAMLFQYMSGKIGLAGYNLVELIKESTDNKIYIYTYWLLVEIAILATDLAEFLGIVVALHLLFNIPLLLGAFLAVFEVLFFLALTSRRFRLIEYSFIIFVSIIGFSFVYEVILVNPDISEILVHSVIPTVNSQSILIVVGIVGATVMPHALLIHSWLVKNKVKAMNDGNSENIDKTKLLQYHKFDNFISLFFAGLINAAMLIMAAGAFYGLPREVATLEDAYFILEPLFGIMASLIFGIALLFAGISSSITGTLAGQAIMEGLIGVKINPWVRRVITRFINVIPIAIAILLGIEPLVILVLSQVVLSIMIPLPLIPILYYSSKKEVMKEFTNKKKTIVTASVFSIIIILLNGFLLYDILVGLIN